MSSDGPFFYEDWSDKEIDLFLDLIGDDAILGNDGIFQGLYHTAYFDFDSGFTADQIFQAQIDLAEYMWDEYGIDFDDNFDWEDYREWYGMQ